MLFILAKKQWTKKQIIVPRTCTLLLTPKIPSRVKEISAINPSEHKLWAKLGDKEWFDKEQIGVKEPFPVTNLPLYVMRIENIWR
jgi:hypothetical protein